MVTSIRGMKSGIIPACAGNRMLSASGLTVSGDHPRVCGEQKLQSKLGVGRSGSSPRVRGTA